RVGEPADHDARAAAQRGGPDHRLHDADHPIQHPVRGGPFVPGERGARAPPLPGKNAERGGGHLPGCVVDDDLPRPVPLHHDPGLQSRGGRSSRRPRSQDGRIDVLGTKECRPRNRKEDATADAWARSSCVSRGEGGRVRRYLQVLALVRVLALVAAACGGDDDGGGATGSTATGASGAQDITPGGTFKAALLSDVTAGFDPQKEYYAVGGAFYRCCLARTLLSYDPNDPDSTHLVPDLAAAQPEISADGLTWVFTIKDGVTFGPPYEDVEITARDFIRALEREGTPEVAAGYYFYYLDQEAQRRSVVRCDRH